MDLNTRQRIEQAQLRDRDPFVTIERQKTRIQELEAALAAERMKAVDGFTSVERIEEWLANRDDNEIAGLILSILGRTAHA